MGKRRKSVDDVHSTSDSADAANTTSSITCHHSFPSEPSPFSEGEKVVATSKGCAYEAKVLEVEFDGQKWIHLIHYLGWKRRWDEWVGADRLMKLIDEDLQEKLLLEKKQGWEMDADAGEVKHKNDSAIRDRAKRKRKRSEIKNGRKRDAHAGKVRGKINSALRNRTKKKKKQSEIKDKDAARKEKLATISIPQALMKRLFDDFEFIKQMGKLVILPCTPSVDDIVRKYLDYIRTNDGKVPAMLEDLLDGLCRCFDRALPKILIYNSECQQCHEATADNVRPSAVYGAEHLLRLFVKLPELFSKLTVEEDVLTDAVQQLRDFVKFLKMNLSAFFRATYYTPGDTEANKRVIADCGDTEASKS